MPETKLIDCECKDWRDSMPQIMFGLKRSAMGEYTGKQFGCCPWCFKKREEIANGLKKCNNKRCSITGRFLNTRSSIHDKPDN